jgi:predicted enzyme related to lactoylglutathione lyase
MSHLEKAGAVLYAKDVDRVSAFYAGLAGMAVTHTEADHVVLESPVLQLIIVAIPAAVAATIDIADPPQRRTDTPIKLAFSIASLDAAREAAPRFGGELNPAEREWIYQQHRVCDAHDPEGNVVQFRVRVH